MAPPIVRTISRYLLRQHVAPLVFALAALTSLMLIQQVAKQLSGLLGKGLPPGVIAEVFVLSLPFIVAVTLPMAVLVAVLHVFTRLAGDNEMTALHAAGGRDLFLTLTDGDIEEVNRTDPTQFNRTFYRTNRMRVSGVGNIFVQTEHDTYKSDREMSTCEMRLAATAARRDASRAAEEARLAIENDLRRLAGLAPVVAPPVPSTIDTAPPGLYCRAVRQLATWLLPAEAEAQTPRVTPPPPARTPVPQYVTPGAGIGEEQRLRDARGRAATYEVEIQKKYAIATACLVFALVGVPVALRFQRGGVGLVIGVSVAVFAVYYVGLIVGEDLGDQLIVSPFLAMWTPNLIFAAAGVFGLWRIRKPGNAPHGGDWSDVVEALRRVVSWPGSLLRPAWRSPR